MKKTRFLSICLTALIVIFTLSSCASGITGKWQYESDDGSIVFDFKSNGRLICSYSYLDKEDSEEAQYTVKDGKVKISYDDSREELDFEIDGDTLTLAGMTLTRADK